MAITFNHNDQVYVKDGKMGIGASDPLRNLHVVGNFAVNGGTGQYYGVYIPGVGEGADPQIQIGDWHNASATIKWDSAARSLNLDTQYSSGAGTFKITGNDGASEFLRITSAGNVGIGTTIPQTKLEVMVPRVTDGSRQEIQRFSHLNENSLSVFAYGGSTDLIQIGAWNSEQNIAIVTEALSSMTATTAKGIYIKSGGNVGIGTTSPTRRLHIRSSSEATGIFLERTSNYGFVQYNAQVGSVETYHLGFVNNNTLSSDILVANELGIVGIGTTSPVSTWLGGFDPSTGNGDFKLTSEGWIVTPYLTGLASYFPAQGARPIIWADSTGTNIQSWDDSSTDGVSIKSSNGTTRFFVREDGNVGIGTTSPADKLHVEGNITLSDPSPEITLQTGATHYNWQLAAQENVNAAFEISVGSQDADASNDTWSPKMVVLQSGNVGIGTTSPVTKLYVDGGESTFNRGNSDGAIARFRGSNAEKAVIGTVTSWFNSNVGIGTTSPSSKLEVVGTLTVGNIGTSRFTDTSAFPLQLNRGLDVDIYGANGVILGMGTIKSGTYKDGARIVGGLESNTGTNGNFSIQTRGADSFTTALHINSSQNVGIGTTSPYGRLELSGSGQSWGTAPAIRMWDSFNSKGWLVGNVNNITAGDFYIRTLPSVNGSPGAGQQEFTIKHATGNVGIGTTSPGYKLDVYGDIRSGGNDPLLILQPDSGTYAFLQKLSAANGDLLRLYDGTDYSTFWKDGKVGIGTNSPGEKLTVETANESVYDVLGVYNNVLGTEAQGKGAAIRIGNYHDGNYSTKIATIYEDQNPSFLQPALAFFTMYNSYLKGSEVERMRISSNGNVGIGTTSPSSKLHVSGDSYVTGQFAQGVAIANKIANYGAEFRTVNASAQIFFGRDGDSAGSGAIGADSAYALSVWSVPSFDRLLVVNQNGNVGIGTTSPAHPLHVNGAARLQGALEVNYGVSTADAAINLGVDRTDSGYAYLDLIGDTTYTDFGLRVIRGNAGENASSQINHRGTGDFELRALEAANITFDTTATERMRITSSGNVGIGLSDPDSRLDINHGGPGVLAGPTVRISKGASPVGLIRYDTLVIEADDVPTIRFGENDGTVSTIMSGDSNLRINSTHPIKFYTSGTTTGEAHAGQGGSFAMIIDNSQKVGIGTTSPSDKLSVNGSIGVEYGGYLGFYRYPGVSHTFAADGFTTSMFGIGSGVFTGRTNAGLAVSGYDQIRLYTNNGERLRIDTSGNVGIGTTNPTAKLHVYGAVGTNEFVTFSNATSGGIIQLGFQQNDTDGLHHRAYIRSSKDSNGNIGGRLDFYVREHSTASQAFVMTMRSNQNVGIGTDSPDYTLSVKKDVVDDWVAQIANTATGGHNGLLIDAGDGANGEILRLRTSAGDSKVSFLSNGNVGIGTTSPGAKLEVVGAPSAAWMNLINGDETAFRLTTYNNGTNNGSATPAFRHGLYYGTTENTAIHFYRGGSSVGGFMAFSTNTGDERMRITTAGNIGIGTTNPGGKLHVAPSLSDGTVNQSIILSNANETGAGAYGGYIGQRVVSGNTRQGTILNGQGSLTLNASNYDIDFIVGAITPATDANLAMKITSTGNVGIGTAGPNTFLHVAGQGNRSGGNIHLGNENDGAGKYGWLTSAHYNAATEPEGYSLIGGYSNASSNQIHIGGMIYESNPATQISFWTHTATTHSTGGSERMRITSSGNVGIGTANPQAKLDVAGVIQIGENSATPNISYGLFGYSGIGLGIYSGAFGANQGIGFWLNNGTAYEAGRWLSGGNLGIGTTSPQYKLTVNSGTDDIGILTASSDSGAYVGFLDNSTSTIPKVGAVGNKLILDASQYVGVRRTDPSYALDVSGTIRATGDVIAYSDARVKENVETIPNALDKVKAMRGVGYNKIGAEKRSIGVIAQEMLEVMPEVVSQDEQGMYSVAYGNLVGVLIEAMKEQQAQIDELKAQLNGIAK